MHATHLQSFLGDVILFTIMTSYVMIAGIFFIQRAITGRAYIHKPTCLMAIFVLCAVCGYLPRAIPMDEDLLLGLHGLLAVLAWTYLYTAVLDLMISHESTVS